MDKFATDHAIYRDSLYGTTPEATYAGATSFMRRKYTHDLDGVDLVVTGVPFDTATTNRPGSRFGPRAIRAASTIMAWERPYGMEFDPFDKLAVVDYGDCYFDFGRPESVPAAIEAHASSIIDQGPGLLTLGGDHFLSYPLLKAHAKNSAHRFHCFILMHTAIPGPTRTAGSTTVRCSIMPQKTEPSIPERRCRLGCAPAIPT